MPGFLTLPSILLFVGVLVLAAAIVVIAVWVSRLNGRLMRMSRALLIEQRKLQEVRQYLGGRRRPADHRQQASYDPIYDAAYDMPYDAAAEYEQMLQQQAMDDMPQGRMAAAPRQSSRQMRASQQARAQQPRGQQARMRQAEYPVDDASMPSAAYSSSYPAPTPNSPNSRRRLANPAANSAANMANGGNPAANAMAQQAAQSPYMDDDPYQYSQPAQYQQGQYPQARPSAQAQRGVSRTRAGFQDASEAIRAQAYTQASWLDSQEERFANRRARQQNANRRREERQQAQLRRQAEAIVQQHMRDIEEARDSDDAYGGMQGGMQNNMQGSIQGYGNSQYGSDQLSRELPRGNGYGV